MKIVNLFAKERKIKMKESGKALTMTELEKKGTVTIGIKE